MIKRIGKTIILLTLTSLSVFGQGKTYELLGKIEGLKVDSLLIMKSRGDNIEFALVKVVNESFYYKDTITEPYFIQILKISRETKDAQGKLAEFMVEPGKIKITGQNDYFKSIQIKGSKSDIILKSYLIEDNLLSDKWHSLKETYDTYKLKGDTLSAKKLAQQLNDITLKERVLLLKSYVTRYRDNIVGALIPNFCTLQEVLKREDYLEMFNLLTDEIKNTKYGQSISKKADL